MKFLKLTTILSLTVLLSACSDEDVSMTNSGEPQVQFNGNFFPSSLDDTWNYDVEITDNDTNQTNSSQDVLTIISSSGANFILAANANTNGVANGTMSSVLTSGELTRSETTLTFSGSLSLPIDGFDLPLDNALLFNVEANNNTVLTQSTGTFTQDLQDIPIIVDYNTTTTQLENLDNLIVNNVTYDTVTSANISVNLSLSTEIVILGFTQTISIIDAQNVMSIDAYYAKDIGLIKAEASYGYTLSEEIQQLPIDLDEVPTSLSITNTQLITEFTIN